MSTKELFENCVDEKKETLKNMLNQKRKLEHDLAKVEFKIKLMTTPLDQLYYDDLPINDRYIYILTTFATCRDLSEFWTLGSFGIQVMLSDNGIHEELPKVMETVDKVLKMIDQYSSTKV